MKIGMALLGLALIGSAVFFLYRENTIAACMSDAETEYRRLQAYLDNQVTEQCIRYPGSCREVTEYAAIRSRDTERTYTDEWLPYCKQGHRDFRAPPPPMT